jgi:tRNA nucleotidyltransferase/poly(A) polymerase
MPDYIYLLENRLSADQNHALKQLRNVARDAGMILFLTGDAVRDLTSGHAVRELEVSVHGNALKLKKPLEKLDGKVWGEDESSRSLYLCFPGTVRVNVVSTHRVEYPRPGKPVYHWSSIQEDLRRRDFTVNSMAISLNEGSFGLLMDPLNGAADIEARTLRLVSNYGFLEQPPLMIRAIRYRARLDWEMDPRTQARYEDAKNEGVIQYLSPHDRSMELEQIGHEEDALKVLRALEAEGWMKILFPAWTSAKADEARLAALHDLVLELQMQGLHPDMSAAQMQLLTARLQPKDLSALKKAMLRPGFVEEWNKLDSLASGFAKALLSKQNAAASASYKLFMSYDPEAVLWLGFTSKDKAVQERFNLFLKVWPEARQRIPYALMQEMRITPELPIYNELVEKIFLELIDGKLTTPEEMRAFLEPHSPPAPAPQPSYKRSRARRAEAKIREEVIDEDEESEEDEEYEEGLLSDELEPIVEDEEELVLGNLPKDDLEAEEGEESEDDKEETPIESAAAAGKKNSPAHAAAKKGAGKQGKAVLPPAKPEHPEPAVKAKPATPEKSAPAKAAPSKGQPPTAPRTKPAPSKAAKEVKPAAPKVAAKPPQKPAAKQPVKPVPKAKPVPKKAAQQAAKKPAAKKR